MPTYRVKSIIDGEPAFEVPASSIFAKLEVGGGLKVLTPIEYITHQQRKWYKGVVLPHLVKHDENKNSKDWWDNHVKKLCNGLGLLKKQVFCIESTDGDVIPIGRLTTSKVGIRKMTQFIEEVLAKSVEKNWGLVAPDVDLKKE